MRSREDSYNNDEYSYSLGSEAVVSNRIKNNLKLIYAINKTILPCIVKFDLAYSLYHKIINITMYQSVQLSRKVLYFLRCRIPAFTSDQKNAGIEISSTPYDLASQVYPPHRQASTSEQMREGDIKINLRLTPYVYNMESNHVYLHCVLYFELNNKSINGIFKLDKPIWAYVECGSRSRDQSYASDDNNISNYYMKSTSKYRNCAVVGYIEHDSETVIYKFKTMKLGLKDRTYTCIDVTNSNEKHKQWNIFTNNKMPDDITMFYRSKGMIISQSEIYTHPPTPT
jgi:hypothetical protein